MSDYPDVWTKPGSDSYHAYQDCGHLRGSGYVTLTKGQARSRGLDLCQYCEERLLDDREDARKWRQQAPDTTQK